MQPNNPAIKKSYARVAKVALTSLLLLALGAAVVLLLVRRDRGPSTDQATAEPLTPVEAAQRATQALVSERMQDPVYREQLQAIDERRTALAVEANELEREITVWQRSLTPENQELADQLAQLAQLRQTASTDETAATAATKLEAHIQTLMTQFPGGADLMARQNELKTRRDALQQEAQRTIALRMQRQQAEKFKTAKPAGNQAGEPK